MTTFHFRLATLLQLRESVRDERRLQLAEAQRTDIELQGQLERLHAQQERILSDCRRAGGPGEVDVPRLVTAHRCSAALRSQAAELERRRQDLAGEIGRRRETLLEADRDVRTLEKLRETQLQAYRQDESRQQAKQLDEVALQATER